MMHIDPGGISLLSIQRVCHWLMTGAVSVMLNVGMTALASATEASRWDGDNHSAVRLIAGAYVDESGARTGRAGIEIKLGAGWKMYWRYPGDAGIPPRFDFAGSTNVADVIVMWPAPQRFSDNGTHLIVYTGNVVLPLRVIPENAAKPVTLRLKLEYGICEKLCILAEAKTELLLSGSANAHELAIAAAEARVLRKVEIGDGGVFAIRGVRREMGPTRPRMIIDVAAPTDSSVDLFAESPGADWAVPLPQPISADASFQRFSLDLDGIPPVMDTRGAVLKLTATADHEAIEVSVPMGTFE